jgi:hypothetical protein
MHFTSTKLRPCFNDQLFTIPPCTSANWAAVQGSILVAIYIAFEEQSFSAPVQFRDDHFFPKFTIRLFDVD